MSPVVISAALMGVLAAIVGALVGWAGNYHVQFRLHRHLRRIDELRCAFYDYVDLAVNYWTAADNDRNRRQVLEAKMMVAQRIISSEYAILAKLRKSMKKSFEQTNNNRLNLWDAATGGRFQQQDWKQDPDRVMQIVREVNAIVRTFS